MAEKKNKKSKSRLSAALKRTIALETAGCFVDNEVLGNKDVALLKEILAGNYISDTEVSRKRALGALARSEKSAASGELIGGTLNDHKRSSRERAAAAVYLGLLPAEAAEKPLLAALAKSHGLLRLEIIRSLGQVGTAKALARLGKIELDENDVATRQLALAQLTIAFREGRGQITPEEIDGKLDLNWRVVTARRLKPKDIADALTALREPTYGISLRSDYALSFDCGRLQNIVLLNDALKPGSFVSSGNETSMIAALIVSQPERKLAYFTVRWLLLSSPGKDRLRMVMVRPNGVPAFEGYALPSRDGLHFNLRDTGLERTPTDISGHVRNDEIEWTIRVSRGPLREKRRPRLLTASP